MYKIAEPIFKAANLENTKIYLVQDESFNAFTTLGDRIYIFSGLINQMPDIDILRGIIAHEAGHIVGGHIARQDENMQNANKIAVSSMALGLLGVMAGNPVAALAPMAMGVHIADRRTMAYSRAMESSADQAALKFLEQSGNSAKGMLESFEYLHRQHNTALINPYDQTHPMSNDRLSIVKDCYQKSKHRDGQNSPALQYSFARSSAKLLAFTMTSPKELLKSITTHNKINLPKVIRDKPYSDEIYAYMRAILYFRLGNRQEAIKAVNDLIAQKPKDPFYHELKGQILFEFGKKEAIDSYSIASSLRPNDLLIRLSKGVVGITVHRNSTAAMKPFYEDLKIVNEREPENILPYYYLAVYYEKAGMQYENLLNSAIIAQKTGEPKMAKALAAAALKGLKPGSPSWYRASDIVQLGK